MSFKTKCFLGIDTSCYTTSIALLDSNGKLLADARKLLEVKSGHKGLAQSEMVFQHTRNLPELLEQVMGSVESGFEIVAIGASNCPRALPDSYMPAFLVGAGYARAIAASFKIALYQISHQENHILAGIWSVGRPTKERFIAVHLSGGTTEIVQVAKTSSSIKINLLGRNIDSSAGQFVDRIGVALGLPFPAGPHLEQLAIAGHSHAASIPVAAKGLEVSFSGPESHARRLLAKGVSPEKVAAGVEICIANSLVSIIERALADTGYQDVLLVGGVMANRFIRNHLQSSFANKLDTELLFPDYRYSGDNAIGCAYFAYEQWKNNLI